MNINNILTKVKPVNRKHTRSKWPLAASQMTACKINHENTKGSKHERKAKFSCFRGEKRFTTKSAKITG
jgi:hypothetical protein